jgi:molybdopterin biosynthesis enzyme MoaB
MSRTGAMVIYLTNLSDHESSFTSIVWATVSQNYIQDEFQSPVETRGCHVVVTDGGRGGR